MPLSLKRGGRDLINPGFNSTNNNNNNKYLKGLSGSHCITVKGRRRSKVNNAAVPVSKNNSLILTQKTYVLFQAKITRDILAKLLHLQLFVHSILYFTPIIYWGEGIARKFGMDMYTLLY